MAENLPLVEHHSVVKTLKDIKVPEKFFNRMKLGVQVLDEIFGGQEWPGIMPGASVLFTGGPGAGKSTTALQFAELLQINSGRNILYNAGEEPDVLVKMRADRLGLRAEFGISMMESIDDLMQICRDTGTEVLFQDSGQTLNVQGSEEMGEMELLKTIGKKLHKFAHDEGITIFLIGHVTKGGDFAGPMKLKHDLDVHAHIRLNPDTMAREFVLTKNRFGPAGIPYECAMSAKGMDFALMKATEAKPEAPGGGSKAGDRREAAKKLIKEAMLKGEKVSRYCHARMGMDCSDGFWGAILERVVYELKAENHQVHETKVGGRTHHYVEI